MSEVDVEMRVENWYELFLILSLCIRTLVRLKVCENLKTNHYVSLVTWDFLLLKFYLHWQQQNLESQKQRSTKIIKASKISIFNLPCSKECRKTKSVSRTSWYDSQGNIYCSFPIRTFHQTIYDLNLKICCESNMEYFLRRTQAARGYH